MTKRRRWKPSWETVYGCSLIGAATLFMAACIIPIRAELGLYVAVDTEAPLDFDNRLLVETNPAFTYTSAPEYKVQNNRLYLLFQTQRGALIMNAKVDREDWTRERIVEFKSRTFRTGRFVAKSK